MKRSLSEKTFEVFNLLLMLFLCVIMVYPYLNQLALSLNEGADSMMGGITIFPRKFTLANYEAIVKNASIWKAAGISAANAICSTILQLVVCVGAAYAMSKKQMPFRNAIIWFLMIPNYISAGMIPTYILYRYLGLLNNWLVYVLPGVFVFYNTVIIRTFLSSLPEALEEAAYIEGANEVQILVKIILPLCLPVLATISLWSLVGTWNDWTTTLYYVNNGELNTLQFVVMQLIKQSEVISKMTTEAAMTGTDVSNVQPTSEAIKSASIIFSTAPIIMSYPFLQKYFVKGVTVGAVKD
ncbi:MAG: carbohydrate ABC transporter permease [Clostridia bacterium]|nr:carbohydrate ABC transporter permease [Clostridia bacterium]